jgi:hypothetical protein
MFPNWISVYKAFVYLSTVKIVVFPEALSLKLLDVLHCMYHADSIYPKYVFLFSG